jgi:hypothetical protein
MGPSLGEVPSTTTGNPGSHASALTSSAPKPQQSRNIAKPSHAANHPIRSAYHTNRCGAVPHTLRSQGFRRFTYD